MITLLHRIRWLSGNLPTNPGDSDLTLGLERSPGGGNGNPLQYSCWENTRDKGAWWTTVHGVTELDTTNHEKKKKYKTYQ